MIKIRGKWTAVLQTFFEATARWRWSGGMSALKFFEVLRSLSVQVWRLSGRQMLCRPRGRTSAGMISTAMTRDTFHLHLEFLKATAHLTVCVNDMRCAKVSVLWWFCASLNHNLAYILKVRCELKRVWKKYEDCPSETERCDFKRENMNNKKEPPGDSIVQDLESCRKDMELLVCIGYRCSGCNVCQWRGGDPTVTVLVFWVCRGEQIFGTFRALVPQLWLMSDRGMRCYDNWHATSSDGGNWIEFDELMPYMDLFFFFLSAVLTAFIISEWWFQNDS